MAGMTGIVIGSGGVGSDEEPGTATGTLSSGAPASSGSHQQEGTVSGYEVKGGGATQPRAFHRLSLILHKYLIETAVAVKIIHTVLFVFQQHNLPHRPAGPPLPRVL